MIGNLTTGSKAMKRRLIEERESAIRNYAAAMAQFKEEGIAEGEKIGIEKGEKIGEARAQAKADEEKRENAKKLLAAGVDIKIVSDSLGISLEDLKKL